MKFIKKYFLAILVFGLGSLSAQTFIGNINPFPQQQAKIISSVDTVKILAVMVEFQKDADNNTAGDGTFNSIYEKSYGDKIIDPLPHDAQYFSNHLEFAKNYFSKVSNGKANIVYQILPQVITISKTMRNYSPAVNSTDFTAMAEFMKEVWTLVGTQNPNFNFADFNLFAIFHAGVGRDISLPGSLGNEKDLPSVYLGLNSLQKYFGPSFDGIQVGSTNFKITNSMMLPQTENREISSFGQTSLFQVSINGLIVANIASFLGLPDLFDTNTGLSAIGKFGLMDGQAIFANRGLFPPEPSAWEKIFLGWKTPTEIAVQAGNSTYTITPSLIPSHQIYKIPINASEYYLVENRQRDVNKDGLNITLKQNGTYIPKTFAIKDYDYFEAIPETLIAGVTTSVDEYDYSLPGSGLLIWHIDEKVINEKIAENKINSDKTRRGVDVEEADGVQDIGEQFTTIFGDQVVGEGTEFDLWYKSNTAKLYHNIFSNDTRPNTNANDGANSLITFQNFSDLTNSTQMTFDVQFGGDVVKPIFRKAIALPSTENKLTSININGKLNFLVVSNSQLYRFDNEGSLIDSVINFSTFKPTVLDSFVVGVYNPQDPSFPSVINVLNFNENPIKLISKTNSKKFTAAPIYFKSRFLLADADGNILRASVVADSIFLEVSSGSYFPINKFTGAERLQFIGANKFSDESQSIAKTFSDTLIDVASAANYNSNLKTVLLSKKNIYILNQALQQISQFEVNGSPENISLADLKLDGNNYILYTNGLYVEAYNFAGACAENFPFKDPMGIGFIGTPLTANVSGLGESEVIATTLDGRIFVIDGFTGKAVDGFPVSIGQKITSAPLLYSDNGKGAIVLLTRNSMIAYNIGILSAPIYWAEENANSSNNAFTTSATITQNSQEFFPKTKAYNWPNPVYDGQTFIRYYVSEDSKINIKIFDLAGDFVAELNNTAIGGMDNETTWNVNNIQSGVYFAHVEATGNSGKTESTIIKIAIVK